MIRNAIKPIDGRRYQLLRNVFRTSATNAETKEPIKVTIPNRIERSPTDLLKALSDTVKVDYTAPHYKFHDDPFLIPQSMAQQRSYALSKESGRKAARYFLDNYPELFYRDDAEPKVAMFSSKDPITESITDLTEVDLLNCIATRQVLNAIQCYKNLRKQKTEIQDETVQKLLELVCFYNSNDAPDDDYLEQLWYSRNRTETKIKRTWQEMAFAEELFNSIKNKTPEAFNALILGCSKYNHAERAYALYEEFRTKGGPVTLAAFNGLIRGTVLLRESGEARWEQVLELLNDMRKSNLSPSNDTFVEVLYVLSRSKGWNRTDGNALKVLREAAKLEVPLSLGAYYYINAIFYDERRSNSPILRQLLNTELKARNWTIQHPADLLYFSHAMEVCGHLNDVETAHELHNLLCFGNNAKLMGDSHSHSIYFKHYFQLIANYESMEVLMDFYDKHVPNTYVPEPSVTMAILNAVDLNEAQKFLPQIWTDLVRFEHYTRDNIVDKLLTLIAQKKWEPELQEPLTTIVEDIIKKIDGFNENQERMYQPVHWSGEKLSNCLQAFVNADNLARAHDCLLKAATGQQQIMGFMIPTVLIKYSRALMDRRELSKLMALIKYSEDVGATDVLEAIRAAATASDENFRDAILTRLSHPNPSDPDVYQ